MVLPSPSHDTSAATPQAAAHASPTAKASAAGTPETTRVWDIAAAAVAMTIAGGLSFLQRAPPLQVLSVLIILIAPGYLLLQAVLTRPQPWHAAAGVGLSIPLLGLLALATSLTPGGFTTTSIVVSVTLGTLVLAAIAWTRRTRAAA